MKKYFLGFIFLFFTINLSAQINWQMISETDTVFYNQDGLFAIYADSVIQLSNSKEIYFYKSIYYTDSLNHYYYTDSTCLDTTAATWLGKKCIIMSNGYHYFTTNNNDSLLFKPYDTLMANWVMLDKDSLQYIATIINLDTLQIENSLDSIKKIEIMVYKNGVLQTSVFNNFYFIVSKNHGIIDAFCIGNFPTVTNYYSDFNYNNLYSNYKRIRGQSVFKNLTEDRHWKYRAGNEWIISNSQGGYYHIPITYIIHDSVMQVNHTVDSSIAIIKRHVMEYTTYKIPNPIAPPNSNAYIDSIALIIYDSIFTFTIKDSIFYWKGMNNNFKFYKRDYDFQNYLRFFKVNFDTTKNYPVVHFDENQGQQLDIDSGNCYHNHNVFEEYYLYNYSYFSKLGLMEWHTFSGIGGIKYYENEQKLLYYNINDTIYGDKNMALPINDIINNKNKFQLYPNPTENYFIIDNLQNNKIYTLKIIDIFGKEILQKSITTTNNITDVKQLQKGIYFVNVIDGLMVETIKLIIN